MGPAFATPAKLPRLVYYRLAVASGRWWSWWQDEWFEVTAEEATMLLLPPWYKVPDNVEYLAYVRVGAA